MSTPAAKTSVSFTSTGSAFRPFSVRPSSSIPGQLRGSDGRMLEVVYMTSPMHAESLSCQAEQASDTIAFLRSQLQSALAEKQIALNLLAMNRLELENTRNETARTLELLQIAQKEMQGVYNCCKELSAQLEGFKKEGLCQGESDFGSLKR